MYTKPVRSLVDLLGGQSPPALRLQDAIHCVEVIDVEHNVHPVVAVLDDANAAQVRQAPGDRTPPFRACSQEIAAMGIDVSVSAGDRD
jgi:hypothetical protein